jgi:hypothetical protein
VFGRLGATNYSGMLSRLIDNDCGLFIIGKFHAESGIIFDDLSMAFDCLITQSFVGLRL